LPVTFLLAKFKALSSLFKGVSLGDSRLDGTSFVHVGNILDLGVGFLLVVKAPHAVEDSDDGAVFQKRQVEGYLGDISSREAYDKVPAIPLHGSKRRLCVRSSNGIVDNINSIELSNGLLQLLGRFP